MRPSRHRSGRGKSAGWRAEPGEPTILAKAREIGKGLARYGPVSHWSDLTTVRRAATGFRYACEVTNAGWRLLKPLLPLGKSTGGPRTTAFAMCAMRFRISRGPGANGACCPTISRRSPRCGVRGYDAGKRTTERKRHIVTDTVGCAVGRKVHSAGIRARDGAPDVLKAVAARYRCCATFSPTRIRQIA